MRKNQPVSLIHIDDYQLAMRAERMSNRTVTERIRIIRMFARETEIQPAHADTSSIIEWLASRDRLSDWTLASYYVNLKQFYKWLQLMELRADNPMLRIRPPRTPNGEPRPVSTIGLQRLLHTPMRRRTWTMIMLAALQGMRVSEIARIRGEHFQLERDRLVITGKGKKTRSMPIHPTIREIVATMPRRGYWFPSHVLPGEHVRGKSVSTMISEAMRRAEVEGKPHGLRHWYGTSMLANGVNLVVIKEAMRHESVATTQKYLKVPDKLVADAIYHLNPRESPAA